jgi:L-ascorbate metabolism protein UlaG (beta-lactamase superfamily)
MKNKMQLAVLALLVMLGVHVSCEPVQSLGKNPEGEDLKKIEALPNYKNGQFRNLDTGFVERSTNTGSQRPRWLRLMRYFISKPELTRPSKRLPSVYTDLQKNTFQKPTVVWFGHSSFLLKTATASILFDPNFSGYAGPFSFLMQSFEGSNVYGADDMPVIDALVISHDHYDHLDFQTIKKLRKKVKRVIVPIGVGSHFRKWGYNASIITELNWNESFLLNDSTRITATPAHHRSNRTFEARKTLWASYVIQNGDYKLYFSGDTGYSNHFKSIGEQYGPFDLAMLECGQYNTNWSQSHMHPTQTAQAAIDLSARMILPIHWAKFAESNHPWSEPVKLLLTSADSLQLKVTTPQIGQPYILGSPPITTKWWEGY